MRKTRRIHIIKKVVMLCLISVIAINLMCRLPIFFSGLQPIARKLAFLSASLMFPEGADTLLEASTISDASASFDVFHESPAPVLSSDNDPSASAQSENNNTIPPENAGLVVSQQFASGGTSSAYVPLTYGYIRNSTNVSAKEVAQIAATKSNIKITAGKEPQVLIMHTHATESYTADDSGYYDKTAPTRNTDTAQNVCRVGDEIVKQLESAGIGVLHDKTLHDYPSYNGSYDRSAETVTKYLKQYPSIKIVLDVHRDALEQSDGARIKPVATIDGKKTAQVMIIAGCDDGTMDMPNWRENLKFASMLHSNMERMFPGLTRPLFLAYRKYNQKLTTGSLLLEMGGHGNTLEESIYAGQLVGKALIETINQLK